MHPIDEAITQFLSAADPQVLCIRGRWGVGKTYAWKTKLAATPKDQLGGYTTYSYVSLFGLENIRDVRRAVFENQTILHATDSSRRIDLVDLQHKSRKLVRPVVQLFQRSPTFVDEIMEGLFYRIDKQIVCIDDIERSGAGLRPKDVLGLLSFLKDEKNCKCVIILNDQKLEESKEKEFREALEKIVDIEVLFDPTPLESAEIALESGWAYTDQLKGILKSLDVNNIRTIRSIRRLVDHAIAIIPDASSGTKDQLLTAVAIGCWAKSEASVGPTFNELRDYVGISTFFAEASGGAGAPWWASRLDDLGYLESDAFDRAVLTGVEKGYYDAERLVESTDPRDDEPRQESKLNAAWRLYRGSLAPNDAEVIAALKSAVAAELDRTSFSSFNSTVKMLRELGQDDGMSELIDKYLLIHSSDSDFLDISNHELFGVSADAELESKMAQLRENILESRSPAEVLSRAARQGAWSRDDEKAFARMSADDFVEAFAALQGDDVLNAIKLAQGFGFPSEVGSGSVSEVSNEALRKLAALSPLNERRLRPYIKD